MPINRFPSVLNIITFVHETEIEERRKMISKEGEKKENEMNI